VIEAWIVLASLALEAVVGYPAALHARIPHPVVWAGNAISALERWWNKPAYSFARRRVLGFVAVVVVVGAAVLVGVGVERIVVRAAESIVWNAGGAGAAGGAPGVSWTVRLATIAVIALIGTVGLAQRSLFEHVNKVLISLRAGDLPASRERVSHIVGRDTRQLDAAGVSAAALESLAESFNDGIVAPAFWFLIAGLPGLFAYKVINTADSLIGHKEERWRAFGWTAARVDDVANLVPARIAGTLLVVAGLRGFGVMLSDASKHASPNAGWPEAAMAGALSIRLGGATTYDGVLHERPVFGAGPTPGVAELRRGLRLYVVACGLLWVAIAAVGLAVGMPAGAEVLGLGVAASGPRVAVVRPGIAAATPRVAVVRPGIAAATPRVAVVRPGIAAATPRVAVVRPGIAAAAPWVEVVRLGVVAAAPGVAAAGSGVASTTRSALWPH
jgi:adenosylcobinamide-phosphate synthase